MAKPDLDERMKALGTAIESARSRLVGRDEFAGDDIGDLLATINHDFDKVAHDDVAAAHARYDAIERRLAAVQGRIDSAPSKD